MKNIIKVLIIILKEQKYVNRDTAEIDMLQVPK